MDDENLDSVDPETSNGEQQPEGAEAIREELQSVRREVTKTLTSIRRTKQTAEGHVQQLMDLKERAQESLESVNSTRTLAEETAQGASEDAEETADNKNTTAGLVQDIRALNDEVIALIATIQEHETNAKAIADIADEKESRVEQYESDLEALTAECEKLKVQIESLLPGATSASLASAFESRKNAMRRLKRLWAIIHIISILAFIGVGMVVLLFLPEIDTYKALLFYFLKKSPVIAALILLEEFSRRNYNIALRLEEDYGYKEVLSTTFDGYRKQMAEIEHTSEMAVSKLSGNLLDALGKEPGRLIDREKAVDKVPSDTLEQIWKLGSKAWRAKNAEEDDDKEE